MHNIIHTIGVCILASNIILYIRARTMGVGRPAPPPKAICGPSSPARKEKQTRKEPGPSEHASTRQLNHKPGQHGRKKENWARNEEIQASIAQQNVRHQVSDALLLLCIQNFKYATMNFAYRW